MPTFIEITSRPTFRDFQGRFARASDELLRARQDEVRTLGSRYVEIARQEAPGETYPSKIGFQTYRGSGTGTGEVGFRVFAPEPLTTFIIEGTPPHIIRARNASVLAFFWEKGPEGPKMYFFRYVMHPGTKPNPFHLRALEKFKPETAFAFRRISTRVFTKLRGS